MWVFLALFTASAVFYGLLLSWLPVRAGGVVVGISLALMILLHNGPRYYLLGGGNDSLILNEAGTGRNWTIHAPLWFGNIANLGVFFAWLMGVGMVLGAVVAYKVKSDRAA